MVPWYIAFSVTFPDVACRDISIFTAFEFVLVMRLNTRLVTVELDKVSGPKYAPFTSILIIPF